MLATVVSTPRIRVHCRSFVVRFGILAQRFPARAALRLARRGGPGEMGAHSGPAGLASAGAGGPGPVAAAEVSRLREADAFARHLAARTDGPTVGRTKLSRSQSARAACWRRGLVTRRESRDVTLLRAGNRAKNSRVTGRSRDRVVSRRRNGRERVGIVPGFGREGREKQKAGGMTSVTRGLPRERQLLRGWFNNGWKGRSAPPHTHPRPHDLAPQSFPILWWRPIT